EEIRLLVVRQSLRIDVKNQKLVGLHAEVLVLVVQKSSDGESGGDQQRKTHGNLQCDRRIAAAHPHTVLACILAVAPERLLHGNAERSPQRGKSKGERGERGNRQSKDQHASIGSKAGIN